MEIRGCPHRSRPPLRSEGLACEASQSLSRCQGDGDGIAPDAPQLSPLPPDGRVACRSVIGRPGAAPITTWTPDSPREPRFLIYSVTKTFTAALTLTLCDAGLLHLDDSIARWFSRVPDAARISIKQLLNHTAGLSDYGPLPQYHADLRNAPTRPWSFERFAAETIEKEPLFLPGQGFSYSNPGYMLLKRIAEQVSGKAYASLLAESITLPLGLSDTTVVESLDDMASLAPGVSRLLSPNGEPRDVRRFYHPGWVSHGVLASTCSDVVRFLDALFRGKLLSRTSLDAMLDLVLLPDWDVSSAQSMPLRPGTPGYGLGIMGDPASPWGLLVGHNGGGPCYNASAFHALDLGVSVCAMAAIEEGFSTELLVAETLDAMH